jgi:hypothetical protein
MTALPASCPNCERIFPVTQAIHIGSDIGATVEIEGDFHVVCPGCGSNKAKIARGIYTVEKEALQILSAPDSTRDMAEALKLVAERLREGKITEEQATKEAEAISPRAAQLLKLFLRLTESQRVSLLVAILTVYLTMSGQQSSDEGQQKLLEGQQEQTETQKKMLDAFTEQTIVLKGIQQHLLQREREQPSSKETEGKASTLEQQPKGNPKVKKKGRAKAKQRRAAFGGARSH